MEKKLQVLGLEEGSTLETDIMNRIAEDGFVAGDITKDEETGLTSRVFTIAATEKVVIVRGSVDGSALETDLIAILTEAGYTEGDATTTADGLRQLNFSLAEDVQA